MLGGILVVMIVKGVTPVLRPLAFQQGKQGLALDVGWDGGSGQFQKSGGVINILHELRDITLLATRQTHQQRGAEGFLIHEALVEPAMLAHVEALVGGVDDQRVIQQIVLLQIIEHDTDVPIHGMDHPKVIVHITLVFPLGQLLTRAFLRLEVLDDRIVIGVPSGFLVRIHAVIKLTADSQVIFHSDLDRYAFDETRYLNTFTDYEAWKDHRSFYMRSFIEPGNRLRFLESVNRGILRIDEPRTYHLTYTLADAFGNATRLSIWIEGKKQEIPQIDTTHTELFHWGSENRFGAKGIRLVMPKGNLYNDLYFRYSVKEDSTSLSATHILHDKPIPLHGTAQLSLFLQSDTLENKQQYGVVRLQNGRASWMGGTYRNGWIDANIKELGSYKIQQDTKAPVITPINQQTWVSKQNFIFRLSDNLSGVQTYRGEIDGQFVLFEMNNKSVITYRFDKERLQRGKHELKLIVTDACGNESIYTHPFTW